MTTYMECGEKYRLRYIEKLYPRQTKSSLLFGKAVDEGITELLLTRDLGKAKKRFLAHWIKQDINGIQENLFKSKNVKYTKNDLDLDLIPNNKRIFWANDQKLSWMSLCRKGYYALESYHKNILPSIKEVLSTQKEVKLYNADGDYIIGYIDAIVRLNDDKVYIVDNKTSSVKYDEQSANESDQLTSYNYIESLHQKIDGVAFFVVSKNIKKDKVKICKTCGHSGTGTNNKTCHNVIDGMRCGGDWDITITPWSPHQIVFGSISPEQTNITLQKYDDANNEISQGKFVKNESSCIGKYGKCDYFNLCHLRLEKEFIKKT